MSQLKCKIWYDKYKELPTKKLWTMYIRRLKGTKDYNGRLTTNGPFQKIAITKILKDRGEL